VAQRRYKKEKEIVRRVKARENKSDVESELKSEDPTDNYVSGKIINKKIKLS